MNLLEILDRLSKLGFIYGIFHISNRHLTLTTSIADDNAYLQIVICFHTNNIGYMATFQLNEKIIINEIYCKEEGFLSIIDAIEVTLKGGKINGKFIK